MDLLSRSHILSRLAMPIDATCPHCRKVYRLKDELVGKTAKCSGPECRKAFVVVAPAPSSPPAQMNSVAVNPAKIDAEQLAAELFADDPNQKPVEEKQIDVKCEVCEFKWTEPVSKVGKNVICPDCKHRQRIPELKKKSADWRDPTAGRRLGEKGPELPADLAAQQMMGVSIDALKKGGAIAAPEVEPRSLQEKLKLATLLFGTLFAVGLATWWFVRSRSDGQEFLMMAEAVKEIETIKDEGTLRKGEPPLLRGVLHLAAGEYSVRLNEKKGLNDALKHYGEVRQELATAPRTLERDAMYGELALALLNTGGTENQVKEETRISWSQHGVKFAPAGNTQRRFVQIELRQLLTEIKDTVDLDLRRLLIRRLARELTKQGQPDLLFEVSKQGFSDAEWPETQCQMLLEAVRNGAAIEKMKALAEQIALGGESDPAPPTAPLLFKKVGLTEFKPPKVPPVPQPGNQMSLDMRVVYARLTGDLEIANAPAPAVERIQGLLALVETIEDPNPALDAAVELVNKDGKQLDRTKASILYRFVRVACDAGQPAKAEVFARAIQDDGLREWAISDALRTKWVLGKVAVPLTEAPKAAGAATLRAGNAWGCVGLARLNAALGGGAGAAKEYDTWGSGELKGFGYAGLALGLQDRK
jgi:hypothetical protein